MLLPNLIAAADPDIFGPINPPPGVKEYNDAAAGGIGIILFASNTIKLLTVIAGVYVLLNIIMAGYIYITSGGDASSHTKVKDQITTSVLGLLIIVASYTIIALISYFIFGRADYILNPEIIGPG
jgi:hypothetical protein